MYTDGSAKLHFALMNISNSLTSKFLKFCTKYQNPSGLVQDTIIIVFIAQQIYTGYKYNEDLVITLVLGVLHMLVHVVHVFYTYQQNITKTGKFTSKYWEFKLSSTLSGDKHVINDIQYLITQNRQKKTLHHPNV